MMIHVHPRSSTPTKNDRDRRDNSNNSIFENFVQAFACDGCNPFSKPEPLAQETKVTELFDDSAPFLIGLEYEKDAAAIVVVQETLSSQSEADWQTNDNSDDCAPFLMSLEYEEDAAAIVVVRDIPHTGYSSKKN